MDHINHKKHKKRQRSLSDVGVHVCDTSDPFYFNWLQNKTIRNLITRRGIDHRKNLKLPDLTPINKIIQGGRVVDIEIDHNMEMNIRLWNIKLKETYANGFKWDKEEEEQKEPAKDSANKPDLIHMDSIEDMFSIHRRKKRNSSLKFDCDSAGAKKQFGDITDKEIIGNKTIFYASYPTLLHKNGIKQALEFNLRGNIGKDIGKRVGNSTGRQDRIGAIKKIKEFTDENGLSAIKDGWTDNKTLKYSFLGGGQQRALHISCDYSTIITVDNTFEMNIRTRIPFKEKKQMEHYYEVKFFYK